MCARAGRRARAEDDHHNKPEGQNARAVVVVNRVSNKLTGAVRCAPPLLPPRRRRRG